MALLLQVDGTEASFSKGSRPRRAYLQEILQRVVRAAVLDNLLYREVSCDKKAMSQALVIVLSVAIVTGIASSAQSGAQGFRELPATVFFAFVGWTLWASITYFMGTKILRAPDDQADWRALARAVGFAQSAGFVRILGLVPGLGISVSVVVSVWVFTSMVVAVREALGYNSYWKPIGIITVGLIPYLSMMVFLNLLARM